MTDVDLSTFGIAVGHATDVRGGTGLTVIRGVDGPLKAGVAILGRATGARELHAATPDHLVSGRIDAVMLTGGSAYGLDATQGVMRWMEDNDRGFATGKGVVPIVPAAVIFDLAYASSRPTHEMAYEATECASVRGIAEGSVGAGAGATVGKILGPSSAMKGGFGCAVESTIDGELSVAAMVVVNALGDVRDERGTIIAGARSSNGELADTIRVLRSSSHPMPPAPAVVGNTTLAVVAVNRVVDGAALTQLARASGAALYRRITPAGSSVDGDIVFALGQTTGTALDVAPMVVEALAVSALERAIERAVRLARGRNGIPGLGDIDGD